MGLKDRVCRRALRITNAGAIPASALRGPNDLESEFELREGRRPEAADANRQATTPPPLVAEVVQELVATATPVDAS